MPPFPSTYKFPPMVLGIDRIRSLRQRNSSSQPSLHTRTTQTHLKDQPPELQSTSMIGSLPHIMTLPCGPTRTSPTGRSGWESTSSTRSASAGCRAWGCPWSTSESSLVLQLGYVCTYMCQCMCVLVRVWGPQTPALPSLTKPTPRAHLHRNRYQASFLILSSRRPTGSSSWEPTACPSPLPHTTTTDPISSTGPKCDDSNEKVDPLQCPDQVSGP